MIKNILLMVCIGLFSACAITKMTRGGYKEASHEVLKKDGPIELRKYSELQLVKTVMENNQDSGFMRLFRYIDGGNDQNQKIAMTTPVFTSKGDEKSTMAFVLPAELKPNEVPVPNLKTVEVATQPEMIVAVRRYAGRHRTAPEKIKLELMKWIENNEFISGSSPIEAFYDPPWIPGFLRRNELIIPVTKKN